MQIYFETVSKAAGELLQLISQFIIKINLFTSMNYPINN